MSQPVGLGIPLSSNNRANLNTPLGGGGSQIAGVQSLNAQAGNLTLLGDASIDVTNIGSGQLRFSTSGNPQNVAAINCTTLAASGSATVGGAVSAASVASTGALTAASLAIGSLLTVNSGGVVGGAGVPFGIASLINGSVESIPTTPVAVTVPANGAPSGTFVIAGVRVMWGGVNNGASPGVTFTPAFSAVPCIVVQCVQSGGTQGYATVQFPTVSGCAVGLTSSAGTGFATAAYWMAIGPA